VKIIRALTALEYLYQPWQIVRRLRGPPYGCIVVARLIWGIPIELEVDTAIGCDIVNRGVHDRLIPESAF